MCSWHNFREFRRLQRTPSELSHDVLIVSSRGALQAKLKDMIKLTKSTIQVCMMAFNVVGRLLAWDSSRWFQSMYSDHPSPPMQTANPLYCTIAQWHCPSWVDLHIRLCTFDLFWLMQAFLEQLSWISPLAAHSVWAEPWCAYCKLEGCSPG